MDELELVVEQLKNNRHRESTKLNYYDIWKCFNHFYIKLDRKPHSWEQRLVLFVGYLIDNNRKSSTIRSYISAIKSILSDWKIKINHQDAQLSSLIHACCIKNDRIATRLPVYRELLHILIDKLELILLNQPYLTCMYKAVFLTAYYGLFRIGKISLSKHVLKAKDVHVGKNKLKMMFVLHSSKTHNKGNKQQIVKLSAESDNARTLYCPFRALKLFISERRSYKDDHEPIFIFKDRSPVKPVHLRLIMKKLLVAVGFDYGLYCFHGIRTGRACDLYKLGFSVETIRKMGRWKSSAIYTYLQSQ